MAHLVLHVLEGLPEVDCVGLQSAVVEPLPAEGHPVRLGDLGAHLAHQAVQVGTGGGTRLEGKPDSFLLTFTIKYAGTN